VRLKGWLALLCGAALLLGVAGEAAAKRKRRAAIRMDAQEVKGKVQLPQAFYVLPRSSLNFEVLELKESFVPKILESVKKKPF